MADRDLGFNFFATDKGAMALFTQLGRDVERLARKLDELDRKVVDPKIKADTKEAEREVGAFAAKMRRTIDAAVRSLPDIELHAKSTEVDREIARVRRELQSLSDKRVGIDIGAEEAQREVQRLERELLALGRRSPNVQVRADVAAALAQLRAVDGAADRVSRNNVHLTARVDGDQALNMLGLITGALAVLGATAPAALATLAAAPALGGALAQGLGAGAAGFSGISDAMSEMEANQKKLDSASARGASSGAASAAQRVAQADRVAAAHRALEQAETQEARAAVQGQWQLRDAQRGVQEAEAQERRDNAAATRELDDRTKDLVQSTLDLQQAMGIAKKERRDDSLSYRAAVYDEEDADKRLTEAKKALAEARAAKTDPEDLAGLVDQAGRAQLALDQAKARLEDAQDAQDEWAAHGVRGSDTVRAAQERVRDAAQAVREAQAEQTRTGIEGARQVGLAEQQRSRTAQQVAWAEQDATRQVAEAKIALAQASRVTATASGGAAAAVKKETEAWDKLGPAGQNFATFLQDRFKPVWRDVRNEIADSMLPKVQSSLESLDTIAPLVSDKLSDTGDVIGRLSQQGADMVTSGPWQRDFATIMDRNNRMLEDFGHAGLSGLDSMRMITVAGGPLAERISKAVEKQSELGTEWLRGKYASGELQQMINKGGDTLIEYAHDIGDIVEGLIDFAQAASPIGHLLLDITAAGGRFISSMPPGLLTVVASLTATGVAAGKVGTLITGLGATGKAARGGLSTLGGALSMVVPSRTYARLEGVRSRIDTVSTGAGLLADKFSSGSKAGERIASAGSRFGRVATGLASGLPIAGLAITGLAVAWDEATTSSEEAKSAMAQGGQVAIDAARDLQNQGKAVDELSSGFQGFLTSLDQYIPTSMHVQSGVAAYTDTLDEQRDSLHGVERAQFDAAVAGADYAKALETAHGNESAPAVVAAKKKYADATKHSSDMQDKMAEATETATEKIREQKDAELGTLNARVDYAQSLADASAAAAKNGRTLDLNTQKGRDNQRALNDLIGSGRSYIQNMQDQRKPANEVRDAQSRLARNVYNTAIRMGMGETAARKLTRELLEIPKNVQTHYAADLSGVNSSLRRLRASLRDNPMTIHFNESGWETSGSGVGGRGGAHSQFAAGAIVEAYADGAVRQRLTPMAAGLAQTVPPNSWRVIGDRPVDDEAYIPVNRSPRSISLLEETARRMGFSVLAMASGAMLGPAPRAAAVSPAARLAAGVPAPAAAGRGSSVLIGGLDSAASARGMAALATATQDLTRRALLPLAAGVQGKAVPALQEIDKQARLRAAISVAKLGDITAAQSTRMKRDWSQAGQRVDQATAGMGRDIRALEQRHTTSFDRMADSSGASVRRITGQQLPSLRSGARSTGQAFGTFRDMAAAQMRSLQRAVADPTRWTLRNPFNKGIINAANLIADQFSLRHVPRVPVGFRHGGRVTGPGTGTSDSIPALIDGRLPAALSTGEFVNTAATTDKHYYFLEALNRGDPEAVQAAGGAYARGPRRYRDGGLVAETGSEHAAQIGRGAAFAAKQSGKPYIWGGTGPAGFDCSGFISAITQAILGGPTTQRLFSTASFAGGPVAGFVPGLNSAWGVGVFQGSPGHIAGTLSGVNAESGGSHGDVRFGPPAVGALDPEFRQHFSLPVVGGKFVGGGGSFDPRAIVKAAFADADRMIDSITGRWARNAMARVDQGAARSTSDGVQARLAKDLSRVLSSTAGGSAAGAGRWKAYARSALPRYGWGMDQFPPLDSLWTKESGWNPRIVNDSSGAGGIPQALPPSKMGPNWMNNPIQQIDWGLGYIKGRYGSPAGAWAHSQSVNWYDGGGIWKTDTPGWNGSGGDELVLDNVDTREFRRMVRILDSPRGQQLVAPAASSSTRQAAEGRTVVINVHGTDPVAAGREMKRLLDFELGR